MAIARYLNDKVCERIAEATSKFGDWTAAVSSLKPSAQLKIPNEWRDIGGLITPGERISALEKRVSAGSILSVDEITQEFKKMYDAYRSDEWQYVYETFKKEYGVELSTITKEQAQKAIDEWHTSATSLHSMILEDSKREFGAFAKIGYGLDLNSDEREEDFIAVRGTSETNSVVQKLVKELDAIKQRYDKFTKLL